MVELRWSSSFASLDELDSVKGVGGRTLEKLRPWLHVGDRPIARGQVQEFEQLVRKPPVPQPPPSPKKLDSGTRINVNTATVGELQRLPGIGPKLAERIAEAREQKPFAAAEDLRRVSGIGAKTVENLRPHLRFSDVPSTADDSANRGPMAFPGRE